MKLGKKLSAYSWKRKIRKRQKKLLKNLKLLRLKTRQKKKSPNLRLKSRQKKRSKTKRKLLQINQRPPLILQMSQLKAQQHLIRSYQQWRMFPRASHLLRSQASSHRPLLYQRLKRMLLLQRRKKTFELVESTERNKNEKCYYHSNLQK